MGSELLRVGKNNAEGRYLWGKGGIPELEEMVRSCRGYASGPAWSLIREEIVDKLVGFEALNVIELGCGVGKMGLLFSLLGADTTLIDYNEEQLRAAEYFHQTLNLNSKLIICDLLDLPKELHGQYDVAMSFGTAEHFWGEERQQVFESHAMALRQGGVAIVWVPNKFGILFHLGKRLREVLGRRTCAVPETPFTRSELRYRGQRAGLEAIHIFGGGRVQGDFVRHIYDFSKWWRREDGYGGRAISVEIEKASLRWHLMNNRRRILPWDNLFSYPLVFLGRKS
jgi:SAM-dependent methyltransferase